MLRALTASQPLKAAAARQARVFSTSFTAMVSICLYALLFPRSCILLTARVYLMEPALVAKIPF